MALAFYRKYRPKKLEELLGQEATIQILQNAAKQDRIGHAYLFYGPRGTGKTTTARLVVKLLNCQRRHADKAFHDKGEPCGECRTCREVDEGNAFDLIEIDAASNRGIDEIRNLKESIGSVPTSAPYKVYIIDEVHMLTGAAFNALLKTLEEPPRHAVLILATTEYEKLPATITSRTQRFLFKKLPKVKIIEKLSLIAKAEGITIDGAALELIAAASEGSLRDAESLLDQLGSLESAITLSVAERLTGRVGFKKVDALAEHIINGDLTRAIHYLAEINEEGHNIIQLTKDLIHYLRKILSYKLSPSVETFLHLEMTNDELKRLKELSEKVSPEKTIPLIKALIRGYSEMRYSPFAAVPLEVALIEHLKKTE